VSESVLLATREDNVTYGRLSALALATLLIAGCAGGGSAPPPAATNAGSAIPADSSAAQHILAHADTSRRAVQSTPSGYDDGGWSTLQLPKIVACGGGTYSNDCSDWVFTSGSTSEVGCTRANPNCNSSAEPPDLNFCGSSVPSDLAEPSPAPMPFAPQTFSLAYNGTRNAPIVTFATRWWAVNVSGSFTGSATTAPAITVTPALTGMAARGWLLFFTWSWPADIMLVPYGVNEIQLSGTSSPLSLTGGSPAQLGAFDCLGRSITALAAGTGFGFSSNLRTRQITSSGSELNAPVWFTGSPNGSILLFDDRGATALTTVGTGVPFPL
jgi:hypothetical protein